MTDTARQLLRGTLCVVLLTNAVFAKSEETVAGTSQDTAELKSSTAGTKPVISLKKGDNELTISGKTKIEYKFQDNNYLLQSNIPDENQFFKHSVELNFDFAHGQEKFGYKAVEAYTCFKHSGVWGKPASFADRESGSIGQQKIKLSDSLFGDHTHATGKSLPWIKEAWLQFSPNAAINASENHLHFFKLGWFPFELGRGIALGSSYGLNKNLLGLYNYAGEDKSAPGLNLHGDIVKDRLSYDLYYARFEEKGKSLSDTIKVVRKHVIGTSGLGLTRGTAKNDEVIAARLNWQALKDSRYGNLGFEPYVYYNIASDQVVEDDFDPDASTKLGAAGLATEYSYKNFEFGGEVAFNFGEEHLFNIDRNQTVIKNDGNGNLVEQFTQITDTNTGKNALATSANKKLVADALKVGQEAPLGGTLANKADRFRPAYTNDFAGWMAVTDAAYKFNTWAKTSVAYAYASGDYNPHDEEKNKKYKGFVGLHENYCGKRIPSVYFLDERLLYRPTPVPKMVGGADKLTDVERDNSFTDLHMLGFGATFTPKIGLKKLSVNPNALFFWAASPSQKVIIDEDPNKPVKISPTEMARSFMGTELNLIAKVEVLTDLSLFGRFALFLPGGYFEDVSGIPLDNDFFKKIAGDNMDGEYDPFDFRLGSDRATYMNIGLEYKF